MEKRGLLYLTIIPRKCIHNIWVFSSGYKIYTLLSTLTQNRNLDEEYPQVYRILMKLKKWEKLILILTPIGQSIEKPDVTINKYDEYSTNYVVLKTIIPMDKEYKRIYKMFGGP